MSIRRNDRRAVVAPLLYTALIAAASFTCCVLLFESQNLADGLIDPYVVSETDDLDHDAINDTVVADPMGWPTIEDPGEVQIIGGADGDVLITLVGRTDGDLFGYAVAVTSAIDGSGINDLIIGAPNDGGGHVYVFNGPFDPTSGVVINADDADLILSHPDPGGYEFGSAVSALADMDDDGVKDILASGAARDYYGVEHILTYVISGATGQTLLAMMEGSFDFDPWEVLDGDVNLDGAVNQEDLDIVIAHQGLAVDATWREGDVNGDRVVDVLDIGLVNDGFGDSPLYGNIGEVNPCIAACCYPQTIVGKGFICLGCDECGPGGMGGIDPGPTGGIIPGSDSGGGDDDDGTGDDDDGDDGDDDDLPVESFGCDSPWAGGQQQLCVGDVLRVNFPSPDDLCPTTWTVGPRSMYCVLTTSSDSECPVPEPSLGPVNPLIKIISAGSLQVTGSTQPSPDCECPPTTEYVYEVSETALRIDSNNDGGIDDVADEEAEDDLPGKIVLMNTGDSDGDGVPGFADGFNLNSGAGFPWDDETGSEAFAPIELDVPATPEPMEGEEPVEIEIKFEYDASPPLDVVVNSAGGGLTYHLPPGSMRIWTKSAVESRDGRPVQDDGDFVLANHVYAPADFGLDGNGGTLTLFVEVVRPSAELTDLIVTADIDGCSDTVFLTAFGTQLTSADQDGPGIALEHGQLSFPTPVLHVSQLELTNLRTGDHGDYTKLIADIHVAGTVTDAASNLLPGDDGIIPVLGVRLNGDSLAFAGSDDPYLVQVNTRFKANGGGGFLRPFDYEGEFSDVITGVEVQPGMNTVQLVGANKYGFTGFADRGFEVVATPPEYTRIDVEVSFIFDAASPSGVIRVHLFRTGVGSYTSMFEETGLEGEYRDPGTGATLRIEPPDLVLDPESPDSFLVIVTDWDLRIDEEPLWVEEFDVGSGVFEGSRNYEDYELEDWFQHGLHVGEVTDLRGSEGGAFNPMFLEFVGPAELAAQVNTIELSASHSSAQRTYELVSIQDRRLFALSGNPFPETYLVLPSLDELPVLETQTPEEELWSFTQGVGDGLVATGSEFVDTAGSVGKGVWHIAKYYGTIGLLFRVAHGDTDIIIAEDRQRLSVAWDAVEVIAPILLRFTQDYNSLVFAALTNDIEEFNRIGEQYMFVIEVVQELYEAIKHELENMTAYEAGKAAGRLLGEVLLEALIGTVTAGVGNVALKSATLTRVVTKVDNLNAGVIPPAIKARVVATGKVIGEMMTSKMCFVAGTLVLTQNGPLPIECIAEGDLVLARCEATSRQGYKPVIGTLVTHPDTLYHITLCTSNDHEETLTGTGQHPFFVVNENRFVPAAELEMGDVLQLADEVSTAYVTDIRVERGPPGATFTTYNFEVADWHTYFVGDAGVWVHNSFRAACERAFTIVRRIKQANPGISHWDSFVMALQRTDTPLRRKGFDPIMPEVVEALMDTMYRDALRPDGTIDLSRVKSCRQINEFRETPLGNRIKHIDLHNHHTVPKQWAETLLRQQPEFANLTPSEMTSLLDDMPGFLVNKHYHTNNGAGVASFHDILDTRLPNGRLSDSGHILQQLEEAYIEWDPDLGPKIWAVARTWLQEKGI